MCAYYYREALIFSIVMALESRDVMLINNRARMNLLKHYCSSDSSEEDKLSGSTKPNFVADYFHLADDSSSADEDLSVRVYTETYALSQSEYGPARERPEDHGRPRSTHLRRNKRRRRIENNNNANNSNESVPFTSARTLLEDAADDSGPACGLPNRIPDRVTCELTGHAGCVSSLEWRGCHLLLSASLDNSVRLWDVRDGQRVALVQKHEAGVKRAIWFHSSSRVLSVGFDKAARLTDVASGKTESVRAHKHYVTSCQINGDDQQTFLAGTKDCILLWDLRTEDPVRKFSSSCGQVLDILMLPGNMEFVCSTELVSRDSADRTLMTFDLRSTALLSNQIYQECYTCPCLRMGSTDDHFLAQSNAGYIATFSTKRPYKLDRYKRYEGHKVMGYGIGFDLSRDKRWIVTGDAEGLLHFYRTQSGRSFTVGCSDNATVSVAWNPSVGLPSTIAVGTWNGEIRLWS